MLIVTHELSLRVLSLTVLSLWIRESSLRKVLVEEFFQSSKDNSGLRVSMSLISASLVPICNPLFLKYNIFRRYL